MKKIIALLMALVMCLTLCACGSHASNENEFLWRENWQDALNDSGVLSFNKNGKGTYCSYDMEWVAENGIVEVTYKIPVFLGISTLHTIQCQVEQNGDDIRLVATDTDNFAVFVPASKHDEMRPIIRQEMIKQAIPLDLREASTNKAKAKQNYEGKVVIVDVMAMNIGTDSFCYQEFDYGVSLRVYMPQDALATLTNLHEITVVGVFGVTDSQNFTLSNAFIVNE